MCSSDLGDPQNYHRLGEPVSARHPAYLSTGSGDAAAERKEVEIKDGKKKEKMKKLFPGYVLVEMIMSDESWYIVRNTPGVTGFLGSSGKGAKPVPLYDDEVERIFKEIGYTGENVVTNYEVGDNVKITDGPFKMLAGKITELDLDAKKANVSIDLFGQETNVELELTQFTKE